MKKTTLWKIVATILLVAVTLPLVSALAPTPVSAADTVPPLPYAMEQYGQHHSGIWSTTKEMKMDGLGEDSYTLMDTFDDQAGNFDGIFTSETADGSVPSDIATEYVPDAMTIYGTYDSTYLYLLVNTVSRTTDTGYSLTADFGFNFGATQKNAQESAKTVDLQIGNDQAETSDSASFVKTETLKTQATDSTGTYNVNATTFEFRMAWADIVPTGKVIERDLDRFYLTLRYRFSDSAKDLYWIYGVPNSILLPSQISIGDAFAAYYGEDSRGTFTPNVVELLGAKGAYSQMPEIVSLDRVDSNTNKARTFEVTSSVSDVDKATVKEAGVIFAKKTASIGGKNLKLDTEGVSILSTTEFTGETKLNYTATFTTEAENYSVFFSLRPYVVYEDDSVLYGKTYSNTPSYYDVENVGYKEYINLLMIGDSFATYFLDEMVQIAKADNIYLTVARSYKSGASAYEDWIFLVNDYKSSEDGALSRKVCSPDLPNTQNRAPFTLKEILAYADWDHISVQDGYDGCELDGLLIDPTYEQNMYAALHMNKVFRYLERNHPNAKLYFHQTWAFQLGWGHENGTVTVDSEKGIVTGGKFKSNHDETNSIMNRDMQNYQYEVIRDTCVSYQELSGIPRIPSGDAWQIARANPLIGDTLCDKGSATDYYHEGDVGGGQYLNACVYYEMITGNDVRGNTWRPSYDISEEKIIALQNAAHEAVLAIYGPDHYSK